VFHVGWKLCEDLLHREGLELPTEAQWEVAARGGTVTDLWGDALGIDARAVANFVGGSRWHDSDWGPMPVDSLRPNPYGFHHMAGNVWEWCRDAADARLPIESLRDGDGLQSVPKEREEDFRMDRGGSYLDASVSVCNVNCGDRRCVWNNEGVRPARTLDR
jgi:formylglycine-generating enzyme required for sulfatase activity